jgi:hypothetical protein
MNEHVAWVYLWIKYGLSKRWKTWDDRYTHCSICGDLVEKDSITLQADPVTGYTIQSIEYRYCEGIGHDFMYRKYETDASH